AREIACNVLATSITNSVVLELRDVPFFSVCYDASNKGSAKMLPIVVQFFSKFGVKHGIFEFIEQQHESADALFNNIKYVIEANGHNLNQLVSIGSDNTNVNVGNNHSVFALFNKLLPRLIKGNCYSHILHNSVILKHIRIRWLSLLQSIERLIAVNPVIKSYFLNLENNECPNLLLKFFTSNKGECSLYFLANILPEVQAANLSLQREYTTGVNLHNIITIGQLLKNIQNSIEVDDLKKSFRSFIRSVISYIEKYYYNNASFYEAISIFNEINIEKIEWKNIQHCTTYINDEMLDLDCLYNDFNNMKSKYVELKEKYGGINKQIQSFLSSNLGVSKRVAAQVNDGNGQSLCDECDDDDMHDFDSDDDERNANNGRL
ncbi:unnamed protein product, partial [Rotaria socialis]